MRSHRMNRVMAWLPRTMTMMCALAAVGTVYGEEKDTGSPASAPASQPALQGGLTVAILDFSASSPGAPELGSQIGEALTAVLSGEPGFTLLDRTTLARALQEHELNLSGVVDASQAIKIGKIVGAQILVTGKAFPMGKQTYITAKIIGTETSLVEALLVKNGEGKDIGDTVMELGSKLAARLREVGPKLVAEESAGADPLIALKKRLKGVSLPKVAVIVSENHYAERRPQRTIDPAVETEIKLVLRECGVEIQDVAQNDLADWAKVIDRNDVNSWPRGLQSVDVVIMGEAFSEFAARIGNLVSCSARAEVNVIQRKDGKIALADRETCRAVDLSENIAGKKALQKTGRAIGIRILEHLAGPPDAAPSSQPSKAK